MRKGSTLKRLLHAQPCPARLTVRIAPDNRAGSFMSTFNNPMDRAKARRAAAERKRANTQDQKIINRMTTTRRLGRIKVRMPEFKCLKDEPQ